jgi:hypothetical protein
MSGPNAPAEYVQLAFMIDRHFPGYVDAYYGPPELKTQATAGDKPPLGALEDLAVSLGQSISTDASLTPDRRTFLEEELRAMRTTIQNLGGKAPNFVDEVRLLYGVTPAWVDESVFEAAHSALNEILPGPEPLPERVRCFRERSRVPVGVAMPIIRRLVEDFRSRTLRLFGLPPEESCEISVVIDRPWMAYNWYLGGGKSRIEFNQDYPMEMWSIPTAVAHEAYPGHHTEYAIKENKLYIGEGRLEHSIVLDNTPSSLISEGIAANALLAVASEAEIAAMFIDCYARAGLSESDAERALAFVEAHRQLESVSDNQLLLLYRDHAPEDEVVGYGIRHALTTEEDEARYLRFFKDPLSRSYAYNYTLGRELIATFLDRATDKKRAFQRLLSEPTTPTQLRGLATTPSQGRATTSARSETHTGRSGSDTCALRC